MWRSRPIPSVGRHEDGSHEPFNWSVAQWSGRAPDDEGRCEGHAMVVGWGRDEYGMLPVGAFTLTDSPHWLNVTWAVAAMV
jgi:hypothetical protein